MTVKQSLTALLKMLVNTFPTKTELYKIRRKANRFFRRFHDRKPSNFKNSLNSKGLETFFDRFSDTV